MTESRPTSLPRVLIVDDDPSVRFLASETLEHVGFSVQAVDSGAAALRAFEETPPELILLDVLLPDINGFTVLERVREHPLGQRLPVIMITGLEDSESIHRAYEAGATDFVTKPLNWTLLPQRVQYVHRSARTAEDLIRARGEALDALRLKSEFILNVTHELRTPFNGILGMCELLLEGDISPGQREDLECVRDSAEQLLTVIERLLCFSDLETGKVTLEETPFDLQRVFETCLASFEKSAELKGLAFSTTIDPTLPLDLCGDHRRYAQVLVNLVGNALRFTETGSLDVELRAEEMHGSWVTVHAIVTDTGLGIPEDDRQTIFAPFVQLDGGMSRQYQGTGLGLAITARFVEILGGRIWVEPNLPVGSVFHCTCRFLRQGIDVGQESPAEDPVEAAGTLELVSTRTD